MTEIDGVPAELVRTMLERMLLQRQLEKRGFELNRQGKIPFSGGSEGHEGLHAGAGAAFAPGRDVLVAYYRDLGLALAAGITPQAWLQGLFARRDDRSGGRQFPNHYSLRSANVLTFSSSIAAHCTHAVGAAFAIVARRERGRAVLCSFGDGATSQGEWHEAMNFAAVHNLPIVFLCENNRYAISTPLAKQMKVERVAQKAAGYGMPGHTVDGFDPCATYQAVGAALESARTGGGPSLVEATCYRYLSHTTDDDDRTYRSADEVERYRAFDAVPRMRRLVIERALMTEAELTALDAVIVHDVDAAIDEVERQPQPEAADLYRELTAAPMGAWL